MPRPDHLEAKARTVRGQGHDFGSSSCPRARGQSSRTPSLVVKQVSGMQSECIVLKVRSLDLDMQVLTLTWTCASSPC